MSHAIEVTTSDATPLGRTDRFLFRIETGLNLIAAGSIFFLMLLGVGQIVARKVFQAPIFGYIDVVEQAIAIFAFLGIAYCQRLGGHIRMELFLSRMSGRTLWLVEAAAIIFAMIIIGIFIPFSFDHFMRAFEYGDSTIDAELPVWPSKLVVPIAFTLLWLRLLLQLIGFLRLAAKPDATPIAVPLIHDVEEQARLEIEEALGEDAHDGDEADDRPSPTQPGEGRS